MRLEWSGVGASTGELGVGIPCGGGGRSAKGSESVLMSVYEGGVVVVCGSPACAGRVHLAKRRSRLVDRTEIRARTSG